VGGTGATLVATLDEADSDNGTDAGELVEWVSSSSRDLMSDEISTLTLSDEREIWLMDDSDDGRDADGSSDVRGNWTTVDIAAIHLGMRGMVKQLWWELDQAEEASKSLLVLIALRANTRKYEPCDPECLFLGTRRAVRLRRDQ